MLVWLSVLCCGSSHCPQPQGGAEVVGERMPQRDRLHLGESSHQKRAESPVLEVCVDPFDSSSFFHDLLCLVRCHALPPVLDGLRFSFSLFLPHQQRRWLDVGAILGRMNVDADRRFGSAAEGCNIINLCEACVRQHPFDRPSESAPPAPSAHRIPRACGSVSDARASFCSATSFGLRLERSAFSASISASLARAFSIRSWVWRRPRARAAWVRLELAAGSASTSAFKATTRPLAAASASSRRSARLYELLPAEALILVPSTTISSASNSPSAMNAASVLVSRPSSTSACATRKSASPW